VLQRRRRWRAQPFGHKQQKSLPLNQIDKLLRSLAQTPGCSLLPPQGLPTLPADVQLPDDLRAFYERAGGAVLYADHVCAGHQRVLGPSEVKRVDQVITGERFATGPFPWWYAIVDVRDGNYVAIDLNPEHHGLCYDAFHETFATPGYVSVIAGSFSDLLARLLNHQEDSSYWLQEGFKPLGEAFALYGYTE